MTNTPAVAVGAPDALGWRKVMIDGKPVGKVRCPGELHRLLRRAGLAFGHDIHWLGGDSTVWPDRPWRRRIIGTLMALGLLTTDLVLVRIGIADFFNALTYAGRIAGAVFILLALLEAVAALATLDYWRKRQWEYSGIVVLIGVLVAFTISAILLAVQLGGRVYTRYLPLWITLVLWSSWALWILVHSQAWSGMRNPRRLALGAVLSSLLAIANLGYTQVYVPYVTSPMLQTAAEFKTSTLNKKGTIYLTVHLHVKNSGEIPVYILGSIYWIHGRSEKDLKYRLIDAGEFINPAGQELNPGEELSHDAVVPIKNPEKSDYDTIKAQTEIYVVRKDRMRMIGDYAGSVASNSKLRDKHKDNDPQGPPGEYYRYQSDISNSDEILNVTRGRQRITLWWVRGGDAPFIYVDVAPPGKRNAFNVHDPKRSQAAAHRYGLEKVRSSMAQTPFSELVKEAQAGPSTQ